MNIEHKPWEWTAKITENGGYNLVKADEETRKKQLEEFKKKRKEKLNKEIEEIDNLF